jgi:hypothetical protein
MRCSLNSADLPLFEAERSERASNANAIRVWDLDKSAWRSFRVDSVIDFVSSNDEQETTE